MFDAIKPAVENAVVYKTETSLPIEVDVKYSRSCLAIAQGNALEGIVRAFARSLVLKGEPKEEITEKLNDLIDSCFKAGDISGSMTRRIKDRDWYESNDDRYSMMWPCFSEGDVGMYSFIRDVWKAADMDSVGWRFENFTDEEMHGLTAEEKAILENYDKIQKEYWNAERIRRDFFGDMTRKVVTAMLMKYGEQLSKLNADLYTVLCRNFDITVNNGIQVEASEVADAPAVPY